MAKDGKTKDVKSWKSTWRDNITAVSQKVAKIRANRTKTGNTGGPPPKLTDREEKILEIIGFDYVEGVQCPDAFPEEQPEAVELLFQGQEQILETVPVTFTVRNNENTTNVTDSIIISSETEGDINNCEVFSHMNFETRESPIESQAGDTNKLQPQKMQVEESQARGSYATVSQPLKYRSVKGTKRGRERLGMQLMDARDEFIALTDRQITCMEMFAKAMGKIAENDQERNAILRSLIENEKNREQTYLDLTLIIKDCVQALKQ